MSNTEELKKYLINGDDGYLLNDNNNGKTIMLSGKWGSGKTHFWQHEIERKQEKINGKDKFSKDEYEQGLSYKLNQNNKACVYISLYGKESISEIKFDIFKEAYNSIVDEDFISKSASFISSIAPSFGEKSLTDGFEKLNQNVKDKKSQEILEEGSIICLDDFERKSKQVDLNDLFGFISYLSIEHNCKIVVILNSDVFKGEEANIFKMVKEKTVNKFFYFEPTRRELFKSIYESNDKYETLVEYKDTIFDAIDETEELNARIYIQVLDNCVEWVEKGYDNKVLREIVLSTVMFIQNGFLLSYPIFSTTRQANTSFYDKYFYYDEMNYSSDILDYFSRGKYYYGKKKEYETLDKTIRIFFNGLKKYISRYHTSSRDEINSSSLQEMLLSEIEDKSSHIKAVLKYGYWICIPQNLDENSYIEVISFVKTGILLSKENQ